MLLVAMGVFLMCLCVYQGFLNINIPQHLSPGNEAFGVFNTAVVTVTSSVNACEKRMCFSLKQESVRPAAWDGVKTVILEALKNVSVMKKKISDSKTITGSEPQRYKFRYHVEGVFTEKYIEFDVSSDFCEKSD